MMCNFELGILNVTRLWFLVKSSILAVKLFSFRMYILAYVLAHFCRLWFKCQPSLQSLCNASAVVILPTPLLSYPYAELYPTFWEGELLQGEDGSQGLPTNLVEEECCTVRNCGVGIEDESFDYSLICLINAG